MGWRTVVISKRAKLDLKLGSVVIRSEDEIKKIHIDEISMLMVESTAVSITAALIAELVKHKVRVIFCDETRSPLSEIQPLHGCFDSTLKIRNQIGWDKYYKELIWTEIVSEKIRNQYKHLLKLGLAEANLLLGYLDNIEFNDITNREGHSAKVYFNALFGKEFSRNRDNAVNAALNYGYSIILSAFNREVSNLGYLTQLGLFHDNMFNFFNLSCDLMEPFRTIVDEEVVKMNPKMFEKEHKYQLVALLNKEVVINSKTETLSNAIRIYCKSVCDALDNKNISLIRFVRNEL